MALNPNLTENQLILKDAELTQHIIDLKAANPSPSSDTPEYAEQAKAKAEHREFKREWRELRQWVVAVNASTAPDGDAIAMANVAEVKASATSGKGD